jgi:hypothetical protein
MAKNPQVSLKPQDVIVLFKLASSFQNEFRYSKFSEDLGIAASEVHAGIKRLNHARLIIVEEGGVALARKAFIEFILFGAIYSFPPVRGTVTRGIPTSYAAQPLVELINQPDEPPPVWPDSDGPVQGIALYPLYPSVVSAAIKDPELYKNLALFDALRSGAAREREIAQQLIRERCS